MSYALTSEQVKITLDKHIPLAEGGNPESQQIIGTVYYSQGDYQNAYYWLLKASNQKKFPDSHYIVGIMYANGQGCKQNWSNSTKSFQIAADNGHIQSCYYLGVAYNNGLGVDADSKKAFELFTKAADGGVMEAQKLLASYYIQIKNYNVAKKYLQKASMQGDTWSKEQLKNPEFKDS